MPRDLELTESSNPTFYPGAAAPGTLPQSDHIDPPSGRIHVPETNTCHIVRRVSQRQGCREHARPTSRCHGGYGEGQLLSRSHICMQNHTADLSHPGLAVYFETVAQA